MDEYIKKLFKNTVYLPESRLSDDIWALIKAKNSKILRMKKFGYFSLLVLSLSGSIFSIKVLMEQFTQLGFFRYLSLIFSDGGIIATYWKEYVFSLVDSLPIASLAVLLFFLFMLFISINKISYQYRNKLSKV